MTTLSQNVLQGNCHKNKEISQFKSGSTACSLAQFDVSVTIFDILPHNCFRKVRLL